MKKYGLKIAIILCVLSVVAMCVVLLNNNTEKVVFAPPNFEDSVQIGVPEVPKELSYMPLAVEDTYTVHICGEMIVKDNQADIYFTNDAENKVWFKVRILDEKNEILAETGIVKMGEYVQSIDFNKSVQNGQAVKVKIMSYEPETYYSAGVITLNNVLKTE